MHKISVIMPVYKENIDQLEKSIDSILNQSFREFTFIIILDNPENYRAKEYILQRQLQDKRILLLENSKNIGSAASLNKGIKISNTHYIALMDADDTCDLERLKEQFQYLSCNEKIDIVFTGWNEIDERGNSTLRIPSYKDFKKLRKTFFYKSPLLHASLMVKSSIFKKYPYSDISRPADFDLFLLLIYKGYNFGIIESNLYTYHIDSFDIDKKYSKLRTFSSNYSVVLFKNIGRYWKNIYFWWMFFLVILQWVLSRNKFIFKLLFNSLQSMYYYVFIRQK